MFLEQICPGQVNFHVQALHTFVFKNDRFIVYATGSKVVIYADPDRLVQVIAASSLFDKQDTLVPVTAVCGSSITGQMAIAYSSQVAILEPSEQADATKWQLKSVLSTASPITCLDWSCHNRLLCTGVMIQMYDIDNAIGNWKEICRLKPATDVLLAKFEPRSNVFATIGKFDRQVTIWYPSDDSSDGSSRYKFSFISHPKYVTHFDWRTPPHNKDHEDGCALFTMARDGIARFWTPLDPKQPHLLYMCAVVDSNQSLVTSDRESQTTGSPTINAADAGDGQCSEMNVPLIHYISCNELFQAVNFDFKTYSKQESFDQKVERIRERIKDTPDFLFRVEPDGSLTLWGVQHLNTSPRRITRVFVVLRVDRAIDPTDTVYFQNPIHIFHDYRHIQSTSTVKPIELSLLARNGHGQIRCYSLNLVDFLDTTSFSPKLHLKYTWLGHQHSISALCQTQRSRFSTVGVDGQMNVWKYELRETCGKMTSQLHLDCSLSLKAGKIIAVPIDKEKYVAVFDGQSLRLYEFDKKDCHLHRSEICEGFESISEISTLHVLNLEEDSTTKERSFLLIAITAAEISTWRLSYVNQHLSIQYRGSQKMQWTDCPKIVQTAAEWTTNTASRLFQQIPQTKCVDLVTCFDTHVIFYSVNMEDDEVHWEELFTLNIARTVSAVAIIKCAPNALALVSGTDRQKLSIFTGMRSHMPLQLTKTLQFTEPICDIAWNLTSDAQYLLAVAFPKKVCVFGQKRICDTIDKDDAWVCYTQFSVDSPDNITALTWVDCGVLSVISGNQIRCYLKWLSEDDELIEDARHEEDGNLEPMSSIFDISNEMNGPLPFYHPRHLFHYLMWGKTGFIHCVLRSLYKFFQQFIDEEDKTIDEVPNIPLRKLLDLQKGDNEHVNSNQKYSTLFEIDDGPIDSNTLIDDDYDDDDDNVQYLTGSEAKNLIYNLKKRDLPGLTKSEKLQLMALVDTIVQITNQGESLDENGARFRTIVENHFHLKKTFSEEERKSDLKSADFIWAFHSQSQDLLLERCQQLCNGKLLWEDARALGIFMWLQKIDIVKEQMTAIARNIYLSKTDFRDPIDCTLFYFALRKKTVVQSLWNTAPHHKEQAAMKKFLANDFSDPRWQRAASKNAFALLGKQRFEYAAAFFLLADKLKDAVNVILKHVKDYQLAIAICRVYDGDDSLVLKDILQNTILPMAIESNDRWLASMALWLLNKRDEAVRAVVIPISDIQEQNGIISNESSNVIVHDPNAFLLYNYLKDKALPVQKSSVSYSLEYDFTLQVARAYERLGCPALSLHILTEFYMPPPSTQQSVEKDTSNANNNENKKLDKAEDLFSSSPEPTPAYAADIFANEPSSKPSYATDLFADEGDIFSNTSKPSYAENLFDDDENDIFAPKKPDVSSSIFENQDSQVTMTDIECVKENITQPQYDGLDSYKALLVIRILQTFFNAASAIYNSLHEPDNAYETSYRTNFLRNRETLLELGKRIGIPPNIFSRLLTEKSIETDVFPLYLHILEKSVPEHFDVHQFLRTFKVGCFEVNEVALMVQEFDYATLSFVEKWTIHVIKTFSVWNRLRNQYCNPESVTFTTRQIALSTYLSNILITLRERQFESSWQFLYHLKGFLEALGTKNGDLLLSGCLDQLLTTDIKMADIVPDEFESISDGSIFGYDMSEEVYRPLIDSQDKSVGSNILELASINYILSVIEHAMQCQGKHNSLSERLSDFIWTTLLDPIAYRAYCLNETIKKQLEDNVSYRNILKQFSTLRQKKFWQSIRKMSSFDKLLPFAKLTPSNINILSEEQPEHFRSIFYSSNTVYGFCTNPNSRHLMAVCVRSEIQEIDTTKASNYISQPLARVRSGSSNGLSHESQIDSYPDTEEDESDLSDHDSISMSPVVKQSTRKQFPTARSAKASGNSSPLVSPAGSRTFDEHVQKVPQTLNIDHLQETLRRSLAKGSDSSKTPNSASPALMDSAERERMIILKRPISTTCIEAHPQYPFYITGCDSSSNGPSAVLWQFGQEKEIARYYGTEGKPTRVHFDQFGQKFGTGDTTGNFYLWRFDAHAHSNKAYYTINCHNKATRDFTFIDSSSLIATAGTSVTMARKRNHVCLWDTLMPPSRALICALPGHERGAYAIGYEPKNQLLFSGGKRGEIVVSDLRQRTTMHTFSAHTSRIRSITIDAENGTLITGSIDGELKIWDVSSYRLCQSYDIQPRNRFLAPTFNRIPLKAFGVTQIQIIPNDDGIYTSGPSGIVQCKRYTTQMI